MIRELSGFFHRLDRLSSFLTWSQDGAKTDEKGPQEMYTYDDDDDGEE
jgi:hypothetical protein